MDRWRVFLNRYFFKESAIEESFCQDLNLNRFLDQVLSFCLEKSGGESAFWMAASELQRFGEALRGLELEKAPEHRPQIEFKGTRKFEVTEIINVLKKFDLAVHLGQAKPNELLLPVVHVRDHRLLGAFVIMGSSKCSPRHFEELSHTLHRLARHLGFCLEHQEALGKSFIDDLTGLYNQKYLSEVLESEIHRSARKKGKFSVLFMDVDFFKAVNDTRGHWVGSRLLVELGRLLGSKTRKSDYCFRYGGDEFVIVLPDTEAEGAMVAAERIRRVVESTDFLVDGSSLRLTLSIGIATYPDHAQSHKDIIKMADQAMYCGKHKSRNIVFMAS